jgi:hypothetical protein
MSKDIGFEGFSAGDFVLGEDELDLSELLGAGSVPSPTPLALNVLVAAVDPKSVAPDIRIIFDDGVDMTVNILGI